MLSQSIEEAGAGRSILADKHGRIIAGNKTYELWSELKDAAHIEVVHADGQKLIVVQRDDLDLDDPKGVARKLAYYDNRVGQVDLEWNAEEVLQDINAGMDFAALFFPHELDKIVDAFADPQEVWQGMPDFENETVNHRTIKIHFLTDEDVVQFAAILQQKITPETKYLWFPAQKPENLKTMQVIDES